ncbi:hypothetical protein PG985_012630 [Apiospora marii]|uniref:uncharacterized protein n=1 Tax=Apiospora marii TaxID=335849 RepID=UPI0031325D0E
MFAIGSIFLSTVWQAATAAGHIIPQDFNELSADNARLPSGDDITPSTQEDILLERRANYTWTPTCKLPAINGVMESVGFDYSGGECVAGTGTLRGFMIFVDFPDASVPAGEDSPQALYETLVPEAAEWYAQASYGTLSLNVTADTSAYYRMPKSAESYHWLNGLGAADQIAYTQDAIDAFTAAHWIVRSETSFGDVTTRQGHKIAKKVTTFGADYSDLNARTMIHETGHTFCLPDYYTFGNDRPGVYVGGFSIMALTQGTAPDFFAWDKQRIGWIPDDAVDCVLEAGTTEHVLTPLATKGPGLKAVVVAANGTAALVAEVRLARGLDKDACAPGVLLYTVDTTLPPGSGPVRVLDATPGSGGCVGLFEDLMDGALSLTSEGSKSLASAPVSSYEVPGFGGVKVTLVKVEGENYTVRIDRRTPVSIEI